MKPESTKTNLVILPTRGRPDNTARAIEFLKNNSSISDICIALDNDDDHNYPRVDGVIYEVNQRLRMNGTLNLVANKYASKYASIFFMGDDHVTRTPDWDVKLYEPIKRRGYGLSYGNDLFQGENLATAVMMSTNIIESLGFMAPPKLIHLYMDNFWMATGRVLKALDYLGDVVIEHMHYLNGKAEQDDRYQEVNSSDVYTRDRATFEAYITGEFKADMHKLIADLGIQGLAVE